MTSCQNELYNDALSDHTVGQAVYISSGESVQKFVEADKDETFNVMTLSLVNRPEKEIKVAVSAGDQEQLDAYNKKNGTNYILMPSELYELPSEIVFPAKYASVAVPLHIKDMKFSLKGTYALPLKLNGLSTPVPGGQDECVAVFEERIKTKSLHIHGSGTEDAHMFPDDYTVPQWTMEVMINRSAYNSNNKSICGTKLVQGSSMMDEIYPRFGDVTIDPNQLQIKTANSQIDVPKDKFAAKPNEWYMISFVYDGKYNKVYVNGELVAEREMRDGSYGLTGLWIGGTNDLIRELRFYKVARTAQQIKNHLWKMVDPTDENLIMYYPLNGKKRNAETGEITVDETKVWDWSNGQHHLSMPSGAKWDDNNGQLFSFPAEQ